jgi:hypothetical protein
MKLVLSLVFSFLLLGAPLASAQGLFKLRVADSADAACFANCSSQAASCKRVCPTTFSTPCLNACDSQYQTCAQGCQKK